MRLLFALILAASALTAQSASPDWKSLEFLVGNWTGVAGANDTPIGAGQGDFSFALDLNKAIIVRRNHAAYESGAKHDDLMVIYLEGKTRAIYFDSEGHVIRYNVSIRSKDHVVFESDGTQPGPQYRLSYSMDGASLNGRFEVAAKAGEYKTYMSWTSKRAEARR